MQSVLSRWFLFGLLAGWAISHATVFGQGAAGGAPPAIQEKKAASSASIEKIREGLEKKVTIDFTGQSIVEALNHFREKTGLPLNIDNTAFMQMGVGIDQPIGQVEIKAKDEKASAVLRKFLNNYNLSSVIFEDALLITTEETAVFRQFRQRVSVNVDDAPFKKTVQDLARNRGINLVIDRSLDKDQVNGLVSLQVDDTGVETAVRLLAEQAGLKAVRMGNVMYVTTAAKAKTIREEEQHQFDNPLNPNFPPVIRGGMMGGFGGGLGGIALPARIAPGAIPAIPQAVPDRPVPPEKALPDPPPVKKGVPNPDGTSTSPPQRPGVEAPPVPVPPRPRRDQ